VRVCVIGGVFGKPQSYRQKHQLTPEVTLVNGLRQRGILADEKSHKADISDGEYDLVHIHHLSRRALRQAVRCKVPLVFTAHNGHVLAGRAPTATMAAAKFLFGAADAVVALCGNERDWIKRCSPHTHVEVIPNGIALDAFPLLLNSEPVRAELRVLYVGQLTEFKGVGELISAVHELQVRGQNAELHIVYQRADDEHAYKAKAAKLGLSNVHFHGALAPLDLAQMYASCDVLVLPSQAEVQPSTILEAQIYGAQVIAATVGCIQGELKDGDIGLDQPNAENILLALDQAARQRPALAKTRLDRATRNRRLLDAQPMIDSHIALYGTVVEQARPRSRRLIRGAFAALSG
jgi:glycosyltransferase involved in cell wall biosynthesis